MARTRKFVGPADAASLVLEIARLHRELEIVSRQRDILKNSLDHLGRTSWSGSSDPEFPEKPSIATEKFFNRVAELHTYVRNNQNFTPNYGKRYWQGERISTAFVESTVNQVLNKRFVKKQPMQWTPPWRLLTGAHPQENAQRRFGFDVSAMAPFVPACCWITPHFLADSRLPVHLAPAEPP
jgi:hypothetical protein